MTSTGFTIFYSKDRIEDLRNLVHIDVLLFQERIPRPLAKNVKECVKAAPKMWGAVSLKALSFIRNDPLDQVSNAHGIGITKRG